MRTLVERYTRHPNCYIGETEGYGYAFVPGSSIGIVVLDLASKRLLEDLATFRAGIDESRVELLEKKGLIVGKGAVPSFGPPLAESQVRNFGTWLHVTNACNLDCPYCYIRKDGKSMPTRVARAYLEKLEMTAARHHLSSISIRIAGGEPTLKPDLVHLLIRDADSRFRQRGVQVMLVLITNGTRLDQSWIDLVKEWDMRLCVSLDGIEEWHNRTRSFRNGRGSFKVVWDNIKLCQEAGLHPTILTTITEQNLDGLESLNHLLIDSNLRFRYGVYRDTSGGYRSYKEFIENLSSALWSCYDYYEKAILEGRTTFKHQLADIRIDTSRHLRCCSAGHSGVTVNHMGEVYLCQSRMDVTPIGTVWDSATFLEMLMSQRTMPELHDKDVRDYSQCSQCQWALTCGGGCPMVNQDTYGTLTTASPYCELFRRFIPRLVDLKALSLIRTLIKKGGEVVCRTTS